MSRLLEELQQAVREYRMFVPGDRILVAVSGGVDSICLLHALGHPAFSLQRIAVYVHHGLRPEADREAEWLRGLGEGMGIPVIIRRIDVRARAQKTGESIQMAARLERYRALRDEAHVHNACRIALAHHADDQAETVLLRILTGTGPEGLGGMAPVNECYIRPLLSVRRSEILAYAKENGLTWREDRSNRDTHYLRNRIRWEVLPELEKIQPRLINHLNRLSVVAREWRDWLGEELAEARTNCDLTTDENTASWLVEPWRAAPRPVQRAILKKGYYHLFPDRRLELVHQDMVLDLFQQRNSGELQLPGAGVIFCDGRRIRLEKTRRTVRGDSLCLLLVVPGETPWPGGKMVAELIGRADLPDDWQKVGKNEAFFGLDNQPVALFIRNRRPGDRIVTFGRSNPEKLKKLLIDAKIPYQEREKVPLVVDGKDNIWWAVGVRHANVGRVKPEHQTILHLIFRQEGN